MRTNLLLIAAACTVFAACENNLGMNNESECPAKLCLSLEQTTKADIQTGNESKVSDIQVFVFKGDAVDAYKKASATEVAAKKVELTCTQGERDIWTLVNAPDMSGIFSMSALESQVSLLSHNATDKFVMVGKNEKEEVEALHTASVYVDRIVSRIRLFQVKRNMTNSGLKNASFKVTRVYMTNAAGNACYDIFTPKYPEEVQLLNATGESMAKSNPFVYSAVAQPSEIQDGASYGVAYTDAGTTATHNFYVYPCAEGITKLVVEIMIDNQYYTYPIPVGTIASNKSYDIKMLTVTRPGNLSNGDDNVDPDENEEIVKSSATFTISVNDWTPVLTFGGDNGVKEGKIEI